MFFVDAPKVQATFEGRLCKTLEAPRAASAASRAACLLLSPLGGWLRGGLPLEPSHSSLAASISNMVPSNCPETTWNITARSVLSLQCHPAMCGKTAQSTLRPGQVTNSASTQLLNTCIFGHHGMASSPEKVLLCDDADIHSSQRFTMRQL